jgi:ABC-type glycerol-3-phosphate transport system permease component
MTRRLSWRSLTHIMAYLISIATLAPLYYLVTTALKTNNEYNKSPFGVPSHATFSNLSAAWSSGLDSDLWHTAIVSGGGALLAVAAATAAGYGLSQIGGRSARRFLFGVIACMMFTPAVLIIPLYVMMIHLKLSNTFEGAILAYAGLFLPFGVYMTTSFLQELPPELTEAARLDGAGPWQIFRRIVLPLSRPVITTLTVLLFLWMWNDLLYALILLPSPATRTVVVEITTLIGQYSTSYPALAAALLIAIAPIVIVFIFFQRGLARGLTMGIGK